MANTTSISPSPSTNRERIRDYRLLREIGGTAGTVFEAEDPHTRRSVAVKLLPRSDRFAAEAQALTRLEHENLVPILDAGEEEGQAFLVMELLKGETLLARLKREHRLPLKEAMRMAREIAAALGFAHAHRLIHRDVCPANIWLEASGRVRLLGLGCSSGAGEDSLLGRLDGAGTPGYLSPEQAAGESVTPASDLFGLGCVLYQMATGDRPFNGDNPQASIRAVVFDHPQSARSINPEISEPLDDLLVRLLAKLPTDRPVSALEVDHRLMEWLDPTAPQSRLQPPEFIDPPAMPASKRILESLRAAKHTPLERAINAEALAANDALPAPKHRHWPTDLIAGILLVLGATGLYLWWKASNELPPSPPLVKSELDKR